MEQMNYNSYVLNTKVQDIIKKGLDKNGKN